MNQSNIHLNQLISIQIEFSFKLITSTIAYESCRALGSLVYLNGTSINLSNLKRLLGSNYASNERSRAENDGLLLTLRNLAEKCGGNDKNADNNKLDLISVQVITNLTLPKVINISSTMPIVQLKHEFIEDQFKLKCLALLMDALRFGMKNKQQQQQHQQEDEDIKCQVMAKCLQGIENLLASIRLTDSESPSNWLQLASNGYQIGDILAIAKYFAFFGTSASNAIKLNDAADELIQ